MAALKLLLLVVFIVCDGVEMKAKEQFSARVVEDLVQQEIARKMPAAATRSTKRGKSLTGVHLKAATDAINKLVDESIVDRVQEAEKEVSQMLLKSIEHHIQDAGKVLLNKQESDNTCRDKLESCEKLKEDGVCESSKDAMVVNCPSTCNFCGMLEDLKKQSEKELEEGEKPAKQQHKKLKSKKLVKVKKGHKVKHHKQAKLAPEELRLIHQNMLDQAIDHANLPMAVSSMAEPVNTEEDKAEQEAQEDEVEKLAAVEHAKEVENQHKEAERTQRKKKKLALKKAKEAKQAKAEALEAGREAAAAKQEAKKAKAEVKHKAAVNPVPMASSVSSSQDKCHPMCAKTCLPSCAKGCCKKDKTLPKHCHPMCKQICLSSCGKGCCAESMKAKPQASEGMCPPGCPVSCAPNCFDGCCSGTAIIVPQNTMQPQWPNQQMMPNQMSACFGSCINSCDSTCPANCCPSNHAMEQPQQPTPVQQPATCRSPCSQTCAPLCNPACCALEQKLNAPQAVAPPPAAPTLPSPFDVCPGTCPRKCAPGCDFDCCRPFLDPSIVRQMQEEMLPPPQLPAPSAERPQQFIAPPPSPAAPPMSKVIHIQHVFTPQQPQQALIPAPVSELPATCPSECQKQCGPACARDGCCTDRRRRRDELPHAQAQYAYKYKWSHGRPSIHLYEY